MGWACWLTPGCLYDTVLLAAISELEMWGCSREVSWVVSDTMRSDRLRGYIPSVSCHLC